MAAEIVEDDDVSWLEGRDEHFLNIEEEAFAIDRPVDQPGCGHAMLTQCRDEGGGLPVAERSLVAQPLTPWCPAAQRSHVRFGPGFIDEDKAGGIDPSAILQPLFASACDVGAVLFAAEQRLFLKDRFSAWTNSHTER